jgi:cobalt/nickel transport system permease protein
LHHVTLDRWSRGASVLHRRDARVKVLALAAFLIAVATLDSRQQMALVACGALLAAGILVSRLPSGAVLARAAVVLPFSGAFAIFSALAGQPERAVELVEKSYLSACAVLLVAGTTPVTELMGALESLRVPRFVVLVVQFIYRYLFVVSEQAQHMRLAASSRGAGGARGGQGRFRAAAGALAVLFARSQARAEAVYRAMAARGFSGRIPQLSAPHLHPADVVFLILAAGAAALIRIAAEVLS